MFLPIPEIVFTDVSGSAAGEIPAAGRARMEYAISFDKKQF
jgi:hypothetical protein